MRDSMRSIIGAAAILSLMTPAIGDDHQIGPGERKSPVRGKRLEVDCPKPKNKSSSLKKLLRK
jgi:hypothetical protein